MVSTPSHDTTVPSFNALNHRCSLKTEPHHRLLRNLKVDLSLQDSFSSTQCIQEGDSLMCFWKSESQKQKLLSLSDQHILFLQAALPPWEAKPEPKENTDSTHRELMSPGLHGIGPRLSEIHASVRLKKSAPPKKWLKLL